MCYSDSPEKGIRSVPEDSTARGIYIDQIKMMLGAECRDLVNQRALERLVLPIFMDKPTVNPASRCVSYKPERFCPSTRIAGL